MLTAHTIIDTPAQPTRRRLLKAGLFLGLAGVAAPLGAAPRQRRLHLVNLHTGDAADVVYWRNGHWRESALQRVDWVMRDHRADVAHAMDRGLLDLIHRLQVEFGSHQPFGLISGYRSPATNAMLRRNGGGVARRSLHLQARAADLRLAGRTTAELRDAALALRAGGVGYYPRSDFVHVDTGRVRSW